MGKHQTLFNVKERKQANSWRSESDSDEYQEIIVIAFPNVCLQEKPHHIKLAIISGTHQDWLVDQAKSRERLSSSRLPWELL